MRAQLAELIIVAPLGHKGFMELLHVVAYPSDKRVPEVARACLEAIGIHLLGLKSKFRVRSDDHGLASIQ